MGHTIWVRFPSVSSTFLVINLSIPALKPHPNSSTMNIEDIFQTVKQPEPEAIRLPLECMDLNLCSHIRLNDVCSI
jgi:hypothetical protein